MDFYKSFFILVPSSLFPCLANSSFFRTTELWFLHHQPTSTTVFCLESNSLWLWEVFPYAENWSGCWATLWFAFLSVITALCCQLYNVLEQSIHIHCPILGLCITKGLVQYQLLCYNQSENLQRDLFLNKFKSYEEPSCSVQTYSLVKF